MQIPPDHNTRAEAMWRIISQKVNFRCKRVIDLGCGTGDFLWRAYVAGADMVIGFDKDARHIGRIRVGLELELSKEKDTLSHAVSVWADTIEELIKTDVMSHDIAMCFSVLPYLDDIPATLNWMAQSFELCLIEAQYAPEPYNVGVLSDKGMAQLLVNNGFIDVEPLGTTTVEDRFDDDGNAIKRTIWMCK